MRPTILALAIAALAQPAIAGGAPGGDLIHRPGICAPHGMPASLGPGGCTPSGPIDPVAPDRL